MTESQNNKTNEDQKINSFFEEILKFIEEKKNEIIQSLNLLNSHNTEKISEKLDFFSSKIQEAEELKSKFISLINGEDLDKINEMLDLFNKYNKDICDIQKFSMNLTEYKFLHDDENKLFKYFNNFSEIKTKQNHVKFSPNFHRIKFNPIIEESKLFY